MGFFDTKSKSETEMTYDNPELRSYTAVYRGAAPWGFASLDPDAALFAMGKGTKLGGKNLGQEAKDHLKDFSAAEKKERQMTDAFLNQIKERQESGQFLTPQETEFINTSLDKAFEYAHKTGYADWEKATQMMAGSRGLRMSDTPAAEPALRELRNFEVGLGSKRAELGLSATLDMSKNQQQFDASFAQFNQQLAQNRWATRQGFLFGGGLQAAGNLGYKTNTTQYNTQGMSGFGKVMAGFQMANASLDLAGRIGGAYTGMPSGSGVSGFASGLKT
jgi:hypothetical protein